ncbi:MAG: class I SAM-dependent methyltransferase, partial [Dehalococcoidia bacterium]
MSLADNYENIIVPAIMDGWAKDLVKIVTPGNEVLDVACGTGVVSRYAAVEAGQTGKISGLDLSSDMLAVARQVPAPAGAVIEWYEGDAAGIPFDDETFDVVLCQFGLMFMPDQAGAIQEMRRVLKPEGKLGISVWCSGPYDQIFEGRLAQRVGEEAARSPIWAFGDADWLCSLVEDAGFKTVSLRTDTKPTRYKSVRQSVEVVVDWSPALQ